ncbi:hypothetical protein ACWJJH_04755 [Endozoicomonadaceae bacterium StTr2]
MKRVRQTFLAGYVMTLDEGEYHIVSANLDIESAPDEALCRHLIAKGRRYEVLTEEMLNHCCPICRAILLRMLENLTVRRGKVVVSQLTEQIELFDGQLGLDL